MIPKALLWKDKLYRESSLIIIRTAHYDVNRSMQQTLTVVIAAMCGHRLEASDDNAELGIIVDNAMY